MAAVSAWAKPGAWALDSEENEDELLQQHKSDTTIGNGHANGGATADFPSLSVAAATKTKKKKPQNMSLQEFASYAPAKPAAFQAKGLTHDELIALPTGPRERTAEELDRSKGFRSYGLGGGNREERRQSSFNRDSPREFTPSRADETDNWATGKKSPAGGGFDRRERGERGGFFSDSQSRADDVDNWAAKKSFAPSEPRRLDRRGSFGLQSSNGGSDSGDWGRKTGGGAFDSLENRRGGGGFESNGTDSDTWGRRRDEGGIAAVGGSRPKLNLQPRTLPVEPRTPPVVEEEKKIEDVVVPRAKGSNPFGAARPREEVLKEKGQDWKEIEEKLESAKLKDVSGAPADGGVVDKRGPWRGNGRERVQEEVKTERAWRKPALEEASPQSANGSENGVAETNGNGHVENNGNAEGAKEGEAQI